jgi:hypothetical protein
MKVQVTRMGNLVPKLMPKLMPADATEVNGPELPAVVGYNRQHRSPDAKFNNSCDINPKVKVLPHSPDIFPALLPRTSDLG